MADVFYSCGTCRRVHAGPDPAAVKQDATLCCARPPAYLDRRQVRACGRCDAAARAGGPGCPACGGSGVVLATVTGE